MAGLQIPNPSITSGAFASMLAFSSDNYTITAISGHPIAGVGGGGTPVNGYWRPSVNADGVISWAWSLESTSTVPSTANIKGSQGIQGETGPQGPSGTNGKDGKDGTNGTDGKDATPITATTTTAVGGTQVTISYTSGGDPLAQFTVLSGAKGADGTNGQNGDAGFSPLFTITDVNTDTYPQGGKHVAIQYGDGGLQNTAFDILNGIDGTGATFSLFEGTGIQITHTGTDYTISVSADYALKSELPDVTDMATKTWVGDQGFLKNTDLTDYALKTYVDTASAEALSQAKSWTNQQNFATSAGLDADKLFAMTRTGWSDFTIPSTSGYLPLSGGTVTGQLTISGSDFGNNLHLKRGNYEGYIGLAGNGAVTIKNVIPNSTSQIEFLTSANKTFDITVKDNSTTPQQMGKLYVMSAHSLADASATSANWANDGMLHIILDS